MDKTYIVGLSGPPRVGKDTIGAALGKVLTENYIPHEIVALSLPMRLAVYSYLGLHYNEVHYHLNKDTPIPLVDGMETTIRKEMIALSERHVKPRLGKGWWAQSLLSRSSLERGVMIVTDMGFVAEHDVFQFQFGAENCVWPHLHRKGIDWAGDSRSYIGNGTRIDNDSDPMTEARRLYGRLVNQYGWKLEITSGR